MKSRLQNIVAKYAGHCGECGKPIAARAPAVYDWALKKAFCAACGEFKRQQEPQLFDRRV